MMKIALVVPTIRQESVEEFIRRWDKVALFDNVTPIFIEDNPTTTFSLHEKTACIHMAWDDIDRELGDRTWIIPRRSDTVRSFGYYWAWKLGFERIMTLDDDCYPASGYENLSVLHLKMLDGRTRWFNTLNSGKPRGMPYYNLGSRPVMVNHGLWTNVLDYDAPTQLAAPFEETFSHDNRVVSAGSYFPFCGMNAMWCREATVLMYHLLMGHAYEEHTSLTGEGLGKYGFMKTGLGDSCAGYTPMTKLPFDRFGDIWCGIIMKKICDELDWAVSSGTPYIRHERASNPFTNLKKEANGVEVNERFWEYIDRFDWDPMEMPVVDGHISIPAIYRKMGEHVGAYDEFKEHVRYFERLGVAMRGWAGLFE